jgi:hypothetical protein
MKTNFFFWIIFVSITSLFFACNMNKASDQILKDDKQRKEIITTIVHNPSYLNEMTQQMMNSDSTQQMMGMNMMEIMRNNPKMRTEMMRNMMNMFEKDSSARSQLVNMMMGSPTMMQTINQKGMMNQKSMDKNRMNMQKGNSMMHQ